MSNTYQVIQTTEKTFNKKIKAQMIALLPEAKSVRKLHVPGCGYVYFYKNAEGTILGKTLKNGSEGMQIYVN